MCFLCWREFSDQNPAIDLGCGHFACRSCVGAGLHACPVCHASLRQSIAGTEALRQSIAGMSTAAEVDVPWWEQAGECKT